MQTEPTDSSEARRRRARRHAEQSRSPHVQGIAPRSIYGHGEKERAIGIALEGARGNIRPVPVIAARKIIGLAQGRDPFSPHARFVELPDGHTFSERAQLIADMIQDHRETSIAQAPAVARARTTAELWRAMPFADQNEITDSCSLGKFGRTIWVKTQTSAMIANNWYDLWPLTGNPGPGSVAGTARTSQRWDDTSVGSLNHRGNVSTDTKHLLGKWGHVQANTPMFMFGDRVTSADNCTFSTSNQTFVNTLGPLRYVSSGEPGLLPTVATCTVFNSTAFNLSRYAYTDDAGNTGQLMPTTPTVSGIVSAAAPTTALGARIWAPSTSANTYTWGYHLPLLPGDSGVRASEDYTASAANTGTFSNVLMHPLSYLIVPVAGVPVEQDVIYQMPELERIFDGACVQLWAFVPAATAMTVAQCGISFGWHA